MSATLPSKFKIPCPLCGGEIEVPTELLGTFAACPHCKEEIPLDRPVYEAPARISAATAMAMKEHAGVSQGTLAACYACALLIPCIGVILGIFLIIKNQAAHGICCILLSFLVNAICYALFF